MQSKKCPFKKGTIAWALVNEDFSDLTLAQIAEVFGTNEKYIAAVMKGVYQKTGIRVKYTERSKKGEILGVVEFKGGTPDGDNESCKPQV